MYNTPDSIEQPKPKVSAGVMMYRVKKGVLQIFLCHPGGPWYEKRDNGCWTIPKGEVEEGEDTLFTALREFKEETNIEPPTSNLIFLGFTVQGDGKIVWAWAGRKNAKLHEFKSNPFQMEWPADSGVIGEFPEVDDGKYFSLAQALKKCHWSQVVLIKRLAESLGFEIPVDQNIIVQGNIS